MLHFVIQGGLNNLACLGALRKLGTKLPPVVLGISVTPLHPAFSAAATPVLSPPLHRCFLILLTDVLHNVFILSGLKFLLQKGKI